MVGLLILFFFTLHSSNMTGTLLPDSTKAFFVPVFVVMVTFFWNGIFFLERVVSNYAVKGSTSFFLSLLFVDTQSLLTQNTNSNSNTTTEYERKLKVTIKPQASEKAQ